MERVWGNLLLVISSASAVDLVFFFWLYFW